MQSSTREACLNLKFKGGAIVTRGTMDGLGICGRAVDLELSVMWWVRDEVEGGGAIRKSLGIPIPPIFCKGLRFSSETVLICRLIVVHGPGRPDWWACSSDLPLNNVGTFYFENYKPYGEAFT